MVYKGPIVVKIAASCDATHINNVVASVASQLVSALDTVPSDVKNSLGDYISVPMIVHCKDMTITNGTFNDGTTP